MRGQMPEMAGECKRGLGRMPALGGDIFAVQRLARKDAKTFEKLAAQQNGTRL